MALVAYDNSDSSEQEEDEEMVPRIKSDDGAETDVPKTEVQGIFNLLPQPSNVKKEVLEEDDEFLHKKEYSRDIKPKSRITIPSLKDFQDVEHTIPSSRTKIPNGKKSGLLSILPEPKNAVRSTVKSLIPNVVTKKPQTTAKKKYPQNNAPMTIKVESKTSRVTEYSDESDNDEVQNDFFSINKPVELPVDNLPLQIEQKCVPVIKKEPRSIESYFKQEVDNVEVKLDEKPCNSADYYSLSVGDNKDNLIDGNIKSEMLDDEAILKLCGSRGKRKREEIQIVDIKQEEVLGDSKEWLLKSLMDDTSKRQSASKKSANEPTSQQRRKHHITYLAHQAKANEIELQNQWSNNRMTKRQTQSKYGF